MYVRRTRVLVATILIGACLGSIWKVPTASAESVGKVRNVWTLANGGNRCLGINYSSSYAGNWANQWDCLNVASQSWTIHAFGTDGGFFPQTLYKFINDESGMCLDVFSNSTTQGEHTYQDDCHRASDQWQEWYIVYRSPGRFWIQNFGSGQCLGTDYSYTGNMEAGINPPLYGINQWGCIEGPVNGYAGHPAQLWALDAFPNATPSSCSTSNQSFRDWSSPRDKTGNRAQIRRTAYSLPECAGTSCNGSSCAQVTQTVVTAWGNPSVGQTEAGITTRYWPGWTRARQMQFAERQLFGSGTIKYEYANCGVDWPDNHASLKFISAYTGSPPGSGNYQWSIYMNCNTGGPDQLLFDFPIPVSSGSNVDRAYPRLELEMGDCNSSRCQGSVRAGGGIYAQWTSVQHAVNYPHAWSNVSTLGACSGGGSGSSIWNGQFTTGSSSHKIVEGGTGC